MPDTWYAIVDGTGALVSTGTTIADHATLTAASYSTVQLASNPAGQVWNPATKTFAAPPAPPTVLVTWKFLSLFTAAEYAAIQASTDPEVRFLMLMLQTAPTINMSDPVVINGVQYLASQSLITSARAATILAAT